MKVAVIYVNPIEYHGPHLPLKTDYEISNGLKRELLPRLQKKFPQIDVVRTVEIHRGCDPAHGPGTEFTSMKELKKIVIDACTTLLKEFRPDFVLFMTFHGAPKHAAAVQAGVDYFTKENVPAYNPFNLVLKRLRDYEPSFAEPMLPLISDPSFRAHYRDHVPQDFHGGLFESSVLMSLHPTLVKSLHQELPDCEERKLSRGLKLIVGFFRVIGLKKFSCELAIGFDAIAWARSPSYRGYTGAPRFASIQIGNYFVNLILEDYENGFYRMINENQPSPAPILQWSTVF
jgi:creatinine amidohydrolase